MHAPWIMPYSTLLCLFLWINSSKPSLSHKPLSQRMQVTSIMPVHAAAAEGESLLTIHVLLFFALPPHLSKCASTTPTSLKPSCLKIWTEVGLAGTHTLSPLLSEISLTWRVRTLPNPLFWKSGCTIVLFRSIGLLTIECAVVIWGKAMGIDGNGKKAGLLTIVHFRIIAIKIRTPEAS